MAVGRLASKLKRILGCVMKAAGPFAYSNGTISRSALEKTGKKIFREFEF